MFALILWNLTYLKFCCVSGGAGGKGTWGKPGSELVEDPEFKDANDPNYDSDSQVS
jgi:hypothetical protein